MTRTLLVLCVLGLLGGCAYDVGSISAAHTEAPPDSGPPPPPPPMGCTRTQGYWKNHEEAWPVSSLTLGGRSYTQAQLLTLLGTPTRGDASLILAKQLIAAKLNVLSGASSIAAIASADTFLSAYGTLPLGIDPDSAAGQVATTLAGQLDLYNNGGAGPAHCR